MSDQLYNEINALRLLGEGRRWDLIERQAKKVLALDPANRAALSLLAMALNNSFSNYEELRDVCERAIQLWPNDSDFHFWLGFYYMSVGGEAYLDSCRCFKQAMKLNPTDPRFHRELGEIYLINWEPAKALEAIRGAVRLRPEHPEFRSRMALALLRCKRAQEAKTIAMQALGDGPDDEKVLNTVGMIFLFLGELEFAEKLIREGLSRFPTYNYFQKQLENCLRERKDCESRQRQRRRYTPLYLRQKGTKRFFDEDGPDTAPSSAAPRSTAVEPPRKDRDIKNRLRSHSASDETDDDDEELFERISTTSLILPVVPLRDEIPGIPGPSILNVGRELSVLAVDIATGYSGSLSSFAPDSWLSMLLPVLKGNRLVLAIQRDAECETPGFADLEDVAVVVEVAQVMRFADGQLQAEFVNARRVRLLGLHVVDGLPLAEVELLPDTEKANSEDFGIVSSEVRLKAAEWRRRAAPNQEALARELHIVRLFAAAPIEVVSQFSIKSKLFGRDAALEHFRERDPLERLKMIDRALHAMLVELAPSTESDRKESPALAAYFEALGGVAVGEQLQSEIDTHSPIAETDEQNRTLLFQNGAKFSYCTIGDFDQERSEWEWVPIPSDDLKHPVSILRDVGLDASITEFTAPSVLLSLEGLEKMLLTASALVGASGYLSFFTTNAGARSYSLVWQLEAPREQFEIPDRTESILAYALQLHPELCSEKAMRSYAAISGITVESYLMRMSILRPPAPERLQVANG